MNLGNLPNLHAVSLYTLVNCIVSRNVPFAALHDINSTIPGSNRLTNLSFEIELVGRCPFHGCLDQDWAGLFNEIIRIGGGRPLELELQMTVTAGDFEIEHPGQD